MIGLSVETNALLKKLEALKGGKGVPYAVSTAINKSARDARLALQEALKANLDRPTPSTLNSVNVKAALAGKNPTEYDIFFRDVVKEGGTAPSKYLLPLVEGGYRANKPSERRLIAKGILPGGWQIEPGEDVKLNQYGNLSGPMYIRILSALKAFTGRSARINRSAASEKRKAKSLRDYFVLYSLKTKTPLGVYTRTGRGDSGLAQILKFTPDRANYQAMLPFRATVDRVFRQVFEGHFRAALNVMLEKVKSW